MGRDLRRLSRREYNNVVLDLLGQIGVNNPGDKFAPEDYPNGYDNGPSKLTVQNTDDFATAAAALAPAAVAKNISVLIGACDPTQNAQACVTAFLNNFLTRAYRRPATDGEKQRLQTVYGVGAANGGGFNGGLELMLEAALQSPSFLYREELGAVDPTLAPGLVRLTDYEVASELSFAIIGSMPDAELFAAAQAGKLESTADISMQATRLTGLAEAKPALRAFLHQWVNTNTLDVLAKDPMLYPALTATPTLAQSMKTELDQFFDQVMWTGAGSLRELLTSTDGFVDANLATLVYKMNAPPGSGTQPVQLDPTLRKGFLTRAGFLANNANEDDSGPVARGILIMRQFLCLPPPPPPNNVPAQPTAATGAMNHETTRQRLDAHLTTTTCRGCHVIIDGIGFGFEEFDSLGAYRTTENGLPIDSSGQLLLGEVQGPFNGAVELENKLLQSNDVLGCVSKQLYRYAMGQPETDQTGREPMAAANVLAAMSSGFSADSHFTDPLKQLIASPAFVLRTTAQ
jgi:hypothetical protein